MDEINSAGKVIPLDEPTTAIGLPGAPQIHFKGGNLQANDPLLDNIQIFALPSLCVLHAERNFVSATVNRILRKMVVT